MLIDISCYQFYCKTVNDLQPDSLTAGQTENKSRSELIQKNHTHVYTYTHLGLRSAFWPVSVCIHLRRCSSRRVVSHSTWVSHERWWQCDLPEGLLHPCGGWTTEWCDLRKRYNTHLHTYRRWFALQLSKKCIFNINVKTEERRWSLLFKKYCYFSLHARKQNINWTT